MVLMLGSSTQKKNILARICHSKMQDFRIKSRPMLTAALNESKNAKLLAINHTAITFDKDAYKGNKKIPTRFTIIRPLSVGWGAAPYAKNSKPIGTKRLSEITTNADGLSLRMWGYEKVSNNMEKGPRIDDVTWELKTGNTILYWLDEQRVRDVREKLFIDRIEEFTVCEIEVASKNNEQTAKGFGVSIKEVRPCQFSMYSCMQDLDKFAPTLAGARAQELRAQQTQQYIARDLVPEQVVFHTFVSHKAIINDDIPGSEFPMVQIANWGSGETIDIPMSVLLKYTNHTAKPGQEPRRDWACSLLEVAIATNSLQLLVFSSDFWKTAVHSSLRAIPIINTETLLSSVIPAMIGTQNTFQTPHETTIDDAIYHLQIHVDPDPMPISTGGPPPLQDLIITGSHIELERAYKITFSMVSAEHEFPQYFVGYFNASPSKNLSAIGFKRRRPTPYDEQ